MNKFILINGIKHLLAPDKGGSQGSGEGEHDDGEQKEDKTVAVSQDEKFAKFREQFTVKNKASVNQGGKPDNESTQEEIDQQRADNERIAKEREAQVKQSQETGKTIAENERKKPGSNVPRIVEEKRKAELERDDFRTRVEKYEKEEKPALEAKIAELNQKIEEGVSPKKEAEFQSKIVTLETQMKEKEDTLVNENQSLKKRLAFYNLSEDDDFKEKYVQPVVDAHKEAVMILTDNNQKMLLRQALAINAQYLRSRDDDERATLQNERDGLLSQIQGDLQGFAGQRFYGAMMNYVRLTEAHAQALQNHEVTSAKIREQVQERTNRDRADRLASWDKTFKVVSQQFDEDTKFTDAEKAIMKDLGLDVDDELKASNLAASNVVIGKGGMETAIDVIHRGRVYPALKAKLKVLEKQIKDRDSIIVKLRGASPGGETSVNEGEGSGKKADEKKPTREEWQKKFSANRAELHQ